MTIKKAPKTRLSKCVDVGGAREKIYEFVIPKWWRNHLLLRLFRAWVIIEMILQLSTLCSSRFFVSFAFEIAFAAPKEQVATTNIMWMWNRHNLESLFVSTFDDSCCKLQRATRYERNLETRKVLARFCMFLWIFPRKTASTRACFMSFVESVFLQVLLARVSASSTTERVTLEAMNQPTKRSNLSVWPAEHSSPGTARHKNVTTDAANGLQALNRN